MRMESTLPHKTKGTSALKTRVSKWLSKHYKALAWVGFALWLLTMYAVLFRMERAFA